jgi:hypothetical protein
MMDIKKFHEDSMREYGFYIHFVFDDCDSPNHCNIHTHGIKESFNHPDFQICVNPGPQNTAGILHNLVNAIKAGASFEVGKKYPDIVINYDIEFIEALHNNRKVLRLLICNVNGTYEGEMYQAQFRQTGLETN